jgi:putative SOS response-associated peptidase YedK
MCYHKSNNFTPDELQNYYGLPTDAAWSEQWRAEPHYHENGFDHLLSPVLTKDGFGYFSWGLIPWYTKPDQSQIIRNQTLNCISEEMFDKPSFRDSLKDGKRCLVPMTGFYEWKWLDSKGKEKLPYYIYLKDQKIFSAAGLYSTWHDKANDTTVHTYTILTTIANPLMTEIHNMKKRMPVIMPREFEKDWLNRQDGRPPDQQKNHQQKRSHQRARSNGEGGERVVVLRGSFFGGGGRAVRYKSSLRPMLTFQYGAAPVGFSLPSLPRGLRETFGEGTKLRV